jgi:Lipid A 3-O-deacylase (PagL)
MPRAVTVAVAVFAIRSFAHAEERPSAVPVSAAPRGGAVHVGGEIYREAWNYNLSDEDLFGGSVRLSYPVSRHWSVGAEVLILWVHQERVPSTPLAGGALLVRRQFPHSRVSYFVEGGGGLSYSARFVPQRGTRFNYIAEAAVEASFRFLHISNNGLAGRDRNPDIEAFGIRIGMLLPLKP